jgi:starch-binding outer membrane protein, SusD/RagB family
MSANYITDGKVRPNAYTATALLAKVYLYQKQWALAEAQASQIINSGLYTLNSNLNDVFLANSTEAIWQLLPVIQGYETPEGASFVPSVSGIIPTYVISNYLLNSFESGDLRESNWLDSTAANGQTYYYPYKYKLGYDGNTAPLEDYMVFRLGEQYLIRAEARAEQNEQGTAIADLNVIRNRAGLANTTAGDQASLLTAIQHERQVELFCEWGNRWYDLKRTGDADTVMPAICTAKGGSWNNDWLLYPVPYTELQLNPFLVQNPGY